MLLDKDTLQYQLNHRPGLLYLDQSSVPMSEVVVVLSKHYENDPHTVPEHDAIDFYMYNHATALLRQKFHNLQPLEDHLVIMTNYHKVLTDVTKRMFHYLLFIVTRESRHMHKDPDLEEALIVKYNPSVVAFTRDLRTGGSSGAMNTLMSNPPTIDIGAYTSYLSEVFNTGSFGGGYGGKAWGAIAEVLEAYVHGVYSAELMVDTAFTLCHNNGPIFNKGVIYTGHNKTELLRILDVQRAGQIPQLVANSESNKVTGGHKNKHNEILSLLGADFGGYVDWYQVEQLGALGSYNYEKSKQVESHGVPETNTMLIPKKSLVAKAEAPKVPHTNKPDMYTITSDMLVPIVSLDRDNGGINAFI